MLRLFVCIYIIITNIFLHLFQDYETETSMLVSLPAEILNIIAKYLTPQDLLSCSTTCVRLRSVFNDNFLWRNFCKPHIMKYVKNFEQKAELRCNFFTFTNSLDEICEQRMSYVKQNQLLNNWRKGRYVEHTVQSTTGLYSLKCGTSIIYNDIYLFLYDFLAHIIVVWNIEDTPVPYTSVRLLFHNYFYQGLYYEIAGQKLVVLEVGKLIQIYDVKLPEKSLPLVSIILFDQVVPLNKAPNFNPEELYSNCYHKIIGKRVYSHKIGKPVLHIWDVETGRKIIALEPPKHGCDIGLLTASEDGNDLILTLKSNDPEILNNAFVVFYEVYSYSFSRNFFRSFWSNKESCYCNYIPFHGLKHKDLVILFCRLNDYFVSDPSLPKTILVIYDYKWGMIIGEKSFPELLCHQQIKVVNNQLLLATVFCLYILDLNSHEIISSFKFDNGKIELLNVFDSHFIISTPYSLLPMSRTKKKEVWDFRKSIRALSVTFVFKCPHAKDCVFVNDSFTKMIIVGKGTLGVLHFW